MNNLYRFTPFLEHRDKIVNKAGEGLPSGAVGPVANVNSSGAVTGILFEGGSGGANGQVTSIRIMNPTEPAGRSPGYPNGYISYGNGQEPKQNVDPYLGETLPRTGSHFPL